MTVLGIETSTAVCAAALVDGEQVRSERSIEERFIHAERLLGMVDEVLREAGTSLDAVEAVAVSIGPGSFTGLRIGLSVAKGLVYATGKPLIAVPTLRAIAENTVRTDGDDSVPFICPVLDARRGEVYCQLFRREKNSLGAVWEERDMTTENLRDALRGMRVLMTGEGAVRIRALCPEGTEGGLSFAPPDRARCSAGVIAQLGGTLYMAGERADPRVLEPRYIKEFLTRVNT